MKIPTRVNKENKLIIYKYSKRFVKTTRPGAFKSNVKYVVRVGNPHRSTGRPLAAELLPSAAWWVSLDVKKAQAAFVVPSTAIYKITVRVMLAGCKSIERLV